MRNSVKVVIDAYEGTTTFYVFDAQDPIIEAYRPNISLPVQGCGCHASGAAKTRCRMTDPEVFYDQEDLWKVASKVHQAD